MLDLVSFRYCEKRHMNCSVRFIFMRSFAISNANGWFGFDVRFPVEHNAECIYLTKISVFLTLVAAHKRR